MSSRSASLSFTTEILMGRVTSVIVYHHHGIIQQRNLHNLHLATWSSSYAVFTLVCRPIPDMLPLVPWPQRDRLLLPPPLQPGRFFRR